MESSPPLVTGLAWTVQHDTSLRCCYELPSFIPLRQAALSFAYIEKNILRAVLTFTTMCDVCAPSSLNIYYCHNWTSRIFIIVVVIEIPAKPVSPFEMSEQSLLTLEIRLTNPRLRTSVLDIW